MAIFNPFVGLQDIFSPTSPASIFRLGVVINKTDNTLTVRNSASGSVTKVFGGIPAIGDTIIFKASILYLLF